MSTKIIALLRVIIKSKIIHNFQRETNWNQTLFIFHAVTFNGQPMTSRRWGYLKPISDGIINI